MRNDDDELVDYLKKNYRDRETGLCIVELGLIEKVDVIDEQIKIILRDYRVGICSGCNRDLIELQSALQMRYREKNVLVIWGHTKWAEGHASAEIQKMLQSW